MTELEELQRIGGEIVRVWEKLGDCEDEFSPEHDPPACDEWRGALDTAIVTLSRVINEHASANAVASAPPTGDAVVIWKTPESRVEALRDPSEPITTLYSDLTWSCTCGKNQPGRACVHVCQWRVHPVVQQIIARVPRRADDAR